VSVVYSCSECQKKGTDEWYVTTHELPDGTFENSATDDADLLVKILYDCFVMFLMNDLYGLINWQRMEKRKMETVPFFN
jgi:hypothetical protein